MEISSVDRTIVVTTYEGLHTHQSPITSRASTTSLGILHSESSASSAAATPHGFGSSVGTKASLPFGLPQIPNQYQQHQNPYMYSSSSSTTLNNIINITSSSNSSAFINNNHPTTSLFNLPTNFVQQRGSYNVNSSSANSTLLRDHGLLQDIVPSQIRKDKNKEE